MNFRSERFQRRWPASKAADQRWLRLVLLAWALAIWPLMSGCSSVAPYQQRLVSKPNMLFNESGAFVYQAKMWLQSEPGSMFSGGARAVGCSACGQ